MAAPLAEPPSAVVVDEDMAAALPTPSELRPPETLPNPLPVSTLDVRAVDVSLMHVLHSWHVKEAGDEQNVLGKADVIEPP